MLNYSCIEGENKNGRKRLDWELAWQLNGREKGRVRDHGYGKMATGDALQIPYNKSVEQNTH